MKLKEISELAYSGKRVYFGNKPYVLKPEINKGACMGCALYDYHCPSRITSLCTQGFIFVADERGKKERL